MTNTDTMPATQRVVCCPVTREPLELRDGATLVGAGRGEVYPIVDGIPVLLPEEADRRRIAQTDWSAAEVIGTSTLDFYNQSRDQDLYCREQLEDTRRDIERWLPERQASGSTLEIGSGKGALQGIGGEYAALDYSFTALRRYIRPEYLRVCGTAERLPFTDGSFAFVFTVAALEHVPGADRAFEEIHRVLAPGGVAYLAPAWHCVQYNCEGIPVRPYKDLSLGQKWVKLTLPIRRNRVFKAALAVPARAVRRSLWAARGGETRLRFTPLRPDYQTFWTSDSDAASRIDSHEGCLFFHSRGYEILSRGSGALRQICAGHGPVVVRKRG